MPQEITKKMNRLVTLYERFQGRLKNGYEVKDSKEVDEAKQLNRDIIKWQETDPEPTKKQEQLIHVIWMYQQMFQDNRIDVF